MGEVVNLRRFRKAKARETEAAAAAENRAAFGQTRGEREATTLIKAKAERVLDGAKREASEPEPS